MRNVIYWFAVILCSIFILFLLLMFLLGTEMKTSFMSNVVFLLLLVGVLIYYIRKIREQKIAKKAEKKQMKTVEYTSNLNLNFNGQISYKDYRNTSLELYFKKRWFTPAIVLLAMISLLLSENPDIPFIIIMCVFILLILPFLIIRSAKKLYTQNKIFHEKLTYHLDNEKMTIEGDTVSATHNWSRFFKIQETRTFFLLYQDSIVANFLDKKMFSADEIVEFRKFVHSLNIKKNLKKK